MRLQTIIILGLTLAGFALRLHYLTTTHPFFDEYTTVLAARQILAHGWPVLPSGLFYEHGLLATYVIAPFTALFINAPLDTWQPAHWGLMPARWPSTLLGTLTIPLIYTIGRGFNRQWSTVNGQQSMVNSQWSTFNFPTLQPSNLPTFQPSNLPSSISLLAAGLFAFSPEGMVWGGRARMYALATLLVLLAVFWAYRGAIHPAPARYRWGAIAAVLATLLTQFGAMILVPPLVVSMMVIGWLSWWGSGVGGRAAGASSRVNTSHASRLTYHASRPWFLRPTILPEILALAAVVGIAVWVKRLGQPVGMTALGSEEGSGLIQTLLDTVTYQTAFSLNGSAILDFLAEQFGPSHLFWLALATVICLLLSLLIWLINRWRMGRHSEQAVTPPRSSAPLLPCLFLWLIFGLILLEMVTVLDPFRQNPRYLVMFLPLFYLIAADSVTRVTYHLSRITHHASRITHHASPFVSPLLISLGLMLVFTLLSLPDLRVALVTPEPAYEAAFQMVRDNWQPDDALLTMNTPAAALYHGPVDGFTVQVDADQFLLNKDSVPIDRWLGAPWIGSAADFNAALNAHPRVWFVIDTIRQPVYFRGDWQAVVNSQMEQMWSQDNALVYRTRPDRIPLPTQPDRLINATLGNSIELIGYTLQTDPPQPVNPNSAIFNLHARRPISNLQLTLFWRALQPPSTDYTVFLHLRDAHNTTIAQRDGLSLDGNYPSSRWQPGETVIDPFSLTLPPNLPPGQYTLWAGMYQLDTLERLAVANDISGENAILLGKINYQ